MSSSPSPSNTSTTVSPMQARAGAVSTSITGFVRHAAVVPFTVVVSALLARLYYVYQVAVSLIFTAPYVPLPTDAKLQRVAVIGAGITGIASAAAFVSHGFEVVIYDAESEIGGIWRRVNSTSALQLNSLMYRFHPSIIWTEAYPKRDEILSNIHRVADLYHLRPSLRLSTPVRRVSRHVELSTDPRNQGHARWVINDGADGVFDAVVGSIGSCGQPKLIELKGNRAFKGETYHSSTLDDVELMNKRVVIIGSGASGVEAAELAVSKHAMSTHILAREDKWIIPRNTLFDIALALKPYGAPTRFSWIPEELIRRFHYRDMIDLSPAATSKGLFEGTPIVNSLFLDHVRSGLIDYKRGDVVELTAQGVKFVERGRGSKPGDTGDEYVEQADVIVLATGYQQPSLDMLPPDLFPTEGDRTYARPNLYLQTFSTEDWSILLTNAAYKNAIGSVGNWHIGCYSRLLMVFLRDPSTRPSPRDMKLWVDVISWLKISSFGPGKDAVALDFVTYAELLVFIVAFHIFRISRIKWLPFVLFGFGMRVANSHSKFS